MDNDSRARNIIAKSLGLFWIIDGLLQCQPKMFAPDFVNNVLAPNLIGQPNILRAAFTFGISAWNADPIIANVIASLLQIAIGLLLLIPVQDKRFKTGLYLSIAWGMAVWIFGEGLGMLFAGSASFYTGAPGSVLIYVLISALLLFPEKIGAGWYPKIAGWIIAVGALLQFQPAIWNANTATVNIFLFILPLAVGLMLVVQPNRFAGIIGILFLFGVWWLGQDFGQLSTLFIGTATDPNTAPVLALLLIPAFLTDRKY